MNEIDHKAEKQELQPGLYLVATPVGNLRDITLRALDILSNADVVACEDTRMTGKLFSLLGIKKKLIPYHDHNTDRQRPAILKRIMEEGQAVALVSDAGMPLISDPGYKLVRDCAEKNIYVTTIPGASAPLMALQLSGLPSDAFSFLGFLPAREKARHDVLKKWKETRGTMILFESASRLEKTCTDILKIWGDREMALARELTKKFEEVWRGNVSDILRRLETDGPPKGEIVLVIGAADENEQEIDLDSLIVEALKTASVKEAVAMLVDQTGLPKKQIYNRALGLKDKI